MIECKNISLSKSGKTILDDVSLKILPGKITALMGPNGAGKSSLIKIISGLTKPDSGTVKINGKNINDINNLELARTRSLLSQKTNISFPFTSFEIVMMGRNPHIKINETPEDYKIVREAIKLVGADDLKNQNYTNLSGGEQQRINLARVIAQVMGGKSKNKFILLDEPNNSLDLKHQFQMMKILKNLAKKGFGIFLIIHDLRLAKDFADEVSLIKNGKIKFTGKPKKVLTNKNIKNIFEVSYNF